MKKTTKFLLVLAAVVAMTIGAVNTVMAADVVVDSATWKEDDDGNWSAKDVNGNEIKNGWAVDAAGRWYYFEDKLALKNEFIKWRGNYYYFGEDCIMCEGWVEFTYKNDDPIDNLDPSVSDAITGLLDKDSKTAYAKSVWCFFEKGGIAAADKWINRDGLWYYFDDVIMVCNDFDYKIEGKTYGFSGDGNMHVGWIPVKSTTKTGGGPTENSKTDTVGFVYYKSNGQMVDAGWEKIGDSWYYFISNKSIEVIEDEKKIETSRFVKNGVEAGSRVMLSDIAININDEKFWLTSSGAMATGTVNIKKDQEYFLDVEAFLAGKTTDAKATTLQFGDNGAQKLGGDVKKDPNYYLAAGDTNIYVLDTDLDGKPGEDNPFPYNKNSTEIFFTKQLTVVNKTNVSTGSGISIGMTGDMIKNAFRIVRGKDDLGTSDDKVYYYDAEGIMVKNDVVDFYGLTLAFDKDGVLIKSSEKEVEKEDGSVVREFIKKKVNGTYYYLGEGYGTATIGDITAYGCSAKKLEPVTVKPAAPGTN